MSFCVLPWKHLATHPHGGVSLCCRVDFTDGQGMAYNINGSERQFHNLNQNSISEIVNADSFKAARLEMLSGQWPKACLGCAREEASGLTSKRQRENEIFKYNTAEAKKDTRPDGSIAADFQYLELRLGNLCNLKCRTCNPFSSSKWRDEYNQLEDILNFVRRFDRDASFKWAEDETFWSDVLNSSKNVKLLFINGGEPTLIKQHWTYLENLIASGASRDIEIKYNINMTQLPEKAEKIWRQFKSVFIGASVDDLSRRNSYIRHGANWDKIEEHLLRIKSWGLPLAIEQTVSAYNVYHLDEVEKYCGKLGIGYGLNFVYDPDFLAIDILTRPQKSLVLQKLKKSGLSDRWLSHVEGMMNHEPENRDQLWKNFISYTQTLDKGRQERFQQTYPEYSELIQYSQSLAVVEPAVEL